MSNFDEGQFIKLAKANVEEALTIWVSLLMANKEEEGGDYYEEDYEPINGSEIEDEFCQTIGAISLKLVDRVGGHEGEGENVEYTFAFSQNGEAFAHFQVTGFYSSWNGTDWDSDIKQVYPHRVMTTVWEDTPQENPPKE